MAELTLESRLGIAITAEVCAPCQAFWFDQSKDFQLSSRSTLTLMKYIGEHTSSRKPDFRQNPICPLCGTTLKLTHDIARSVRFTYWDCMNQHGHFIGFLEFLKEKNFIHPLSRERSAVARECPHGELLKLWRLDRPAKQLCLPVLQIADYNARPERAEADAGAAETGCGAQTGRPDSSLETRPG
jgi:hypothetical protein